MKHIKQFLCLVVGCFLLTGTAKATTGQQLYSDLINPSLLVTTAAMGYVNGAWSGAVTALFVVKPINRPFYSCMMAYYNMEHTNERREDVIMFLQNHNDDLSTDAAISVYLTFYNKFYTKCSSLIPRW